MMRIITGSARGAKLEAPEGLTTRPTSERTKEAVFSSLGKSVLEARVLDLFAGSGQMGLEALSRGAKFCVFCDADKSAIKVIEKNIEKVRVKEKSKVENTDFSACLYKQKEKFDLVFLDPPYKLTLLPKAIDILIKKDLLSENALVVCETAEKMEVPLGFEAKKEAHYGVAFITILQKN